MRRRAANMPRTICGSPPPRSCMRSTPMRSRNSPARSSRGSVRPMRSRSPNARRACSRARPRTSTTATHCRWRAATRTPWRRIARRSRSMPTGRRCATTSRSRCGCRAAAARRRSRCSKRRCASIHATCRRGLISSSRGSRRTTGRRARVRGAARRLAPDNALAMNNVALAMKEAQRWDDAERYAARACELAPDDASYRFNLAIIQLVRGNVAAGWRGHEARWDGAGELRGRRPVLPGPRWQGEPLAGKTLLVWGEQGRRRAAVLPLRRAARRARAPRGRQARLEYVPAGGHADAAQPRPACGRIQRGRRHRIAAGLRLRSAADRPAADARHGSVDARVVGALPAGRSACARCVARAARGRPPAEGRSRVDGQRGAPAQSVPAGGSSAMPTRSAGSTASRFIRCSRARTRMSRRRARRASRSRTSRRN